ncbi:hypothetical protein Fmac_001371 [Flemingia macrophylla]|uniref:Uncharacterized protein n=1 Tax=Flemingia macrophylla TaxID=520843 RepID=A0ABD1NHE2_9FABA
MEEISIALLEEDEISCKEELEKQGKTVIVVFSCGGPRIPHPQRVTMLQSHYNRVESLQGFTLHPARSLEFNILYTMGWEDDVLRYIRNIGWDFLMSFYPKIHPRATTEFLAISFYVEIHILGEGMPSSWMVSYWMNEAYRSTTLDDFNIQCRFISSEDIYTEEYQTTYLAKPNYL